MTYSITIFTHDKEKCISHQLMTEILKKEWIILLEQISITESNDTLTLFLDCSYMNQSHIESLVEVSQKSLGTIKEVYMHNIDRLLLVSLEIT